MLIAVLAEVFQVMVRENVAPWSATMLYIPAGGQQLMDASFGRSVVSYILQHLQATNTGYLLGIIEI